MAVVEAKAARHEIEETASQDFGDVRAEHHGAGHGTLGAEFPQLWIEDGHGGAHGFGGGHHVGQIHLSAGELLAHLVHAGDIAVVDGIDWSGACGESPLR